MSEQISGQNEKHPIVMATLNVNGLPRFRQSSQTKALLRPYHSRHLEICGLLEASDIDVLNLQEVFTHRQRRLLQRHLPSFGYVAYESSLFGPKGALLTLSRLPMQKVSYQSYAAATKPGNTKDLPPLSLLKSGMKGMLVSRLMHTPLTVVNTHPLANDDWDWSPENRFYDLQHGQLELLAKVVREQSSQGYEVAVGCDSNVDKTSQLFRAFLGSSGLHDVFAGDTAPTFYEAFLKDGQQAQCIDVLLASGGVTGADARRISMHEQQVYLTDHDGLRASLTVAP